MATRQVAAQRLVLCWGNVTLQRALRFTEVLQAGKDFELLVAAHYGASVEQDTSSDAEANAPWRERWRVERPECWSELPWSRACDR